jgi:helicase SWR1
MYNHCYSFTDYFKQVLTYFGTAKQRKQLRVGWSKLNSFHVCITSYQIVLSDNNMFKRKKWYYMILDEAHHIKNYMSKKWQILLYFNTFRRLLLSGTPLQNNILELWSLLHFLMPYLFNSRKEFAYWFADPLNKLTENPSGTSGKANSQQDNNMEALYNNISNTAESTAPSNSIVARLHTIIRPFILRRLKSEVATQLPNKYEYVLYCKMSKRQLYLYEEFISNNSVYNPSGGGGNSYISMMNVLMQLRKICNHPDLLEPRIINTPYIFNLVDYSVHKQVLNITNTLTMDDNVNEGSISKKYVNLYDKNIYPVFVEDMHISELKRQYRSADTNNLLRSYIASLLQHLGATIQSSSSSNFVALPRLEPYYHSIIQSPTWTSIYDKYLSKCYHTEMFDQPSSESLIVPNTTYKHCQITWEHPSLHDSVHLYLQSILSTSQKYFLVTVPTVLSSGPRLVCKASYSFAKEPNVQRQVQALIRQMLLLRTIIIFPDKKLIQYDCGKLQLLAKLLHNIKNNKVNSNGNIASKYGHSMNKVLIFTQMSKMLDILEVFLNLNNFTFLRLDGSTHIEKRQHLMDQFNNDPRIFIFILSTRSGGLGINLTGANHVIFYDTGK